jgi:hypothetical protein
LDGTRCEAGLDLSAGFLSTPGADACSLSGSSLRGTLVMKDTALIDGPLDLTGA